MKVILEQPASIINIIKIDSREKIDSLKDYIAAQKTEIDICKEKIKNLENANRELQSLLNSNVENKFYNLLKDQFSQNQVDLILKKKKQVRWTAEELGNAFALIYFSKKGYVYLKDHLNYPLPGIATLQRWAAKINLRKGLLTEIIKFMAMFGESLTSLKKICVITYDEMKVSSMYEFGMQQNEIVGPHHYLQIIMVRGLFDSWKQPIYISFDQRITIDILNTVITHLHNIDFNVVACTSDCGAANVALWRTLDISMDKTYFLHPVTDEKIYMFVDVPHLLKLIRNWMLDTGFTLTEGKIINKQPLLALIKGNKTETNAFFHLRKKHIECQRNERQKIQLAAELLSNKTATALQHYKSGPDIELANNVADFINLISSWFDVMNSSSKENDILTKKPYGLDVVHQDNILNTVMKTFKTMRCIGKHTLETFQKGVCITTKSIQELFQDLEIKYNIKYILTQRLTKDVLENFFCQV